jgi:hypothetical protein
MQRGGGRDEKQDDQDRERKARLIVSQIKPGHIAVVAFVAAANIIGFARAAALDPTLQGIAAIGDVQLGADVGAVAVGEQRFSLHARE